MERLSKMNMPECYEPSCYEQQEYDSDYDSEYDSDDERSTRKRLVLGPVQLAPKKCKCVRCHWNGEEKECEQKWITLSQMQADYEEQSKLKCSALQVETSMSIAKMQAEHMAALKSVEDQSRLVLSQHIAFMATLPKESKAGRERREAEKKKAHLEKMSRQVHKARGFKKRVLKETDPEVIKARRASSRKVSRDTKKEAEVERALTFVTVVNEVSVNEVFDSNDSKVAEVLDNEVVEELLGNEVVKEVAGGHLNEVLDSKVTEVLDNEVVLGNEVVKEVAEVVVVKKVVDVEDNWQEVKPRKKQQLSLQPAKQVTLHTQMCESVALNKSCRHGGNCRFAHSVAELAFAECSFGNNCNNVEHTGSGVYSSVYGKSCIRLHPGETKESVCIRVGIIIPKVAKVAQFSSVYMPALAGVKSVPQITTSSAWQKQIKIQPDSTRLETKPVVKAPEVKISVSTSETIRAEAFATLANSKSVDSTLLRTRMCDSVETKKPCRHGTSCRFAHSISELVFAKCLFGESCRHVEYQNKGVYNNVWGKSCNRLHPYETNASICVRSGLVKQAPVVKHELLVKPAAPVVNQAPVVPVLLTQEETVLRVPKELVVQAMELAIKSGKTNIRVEII
jgi:hypothetical protein